MPDMQPLTDEPHRRSSLRRDLLMGFVIISALVVGVFGAVRMDKSSTPNVSVPPARPQPTATSPPPSLANATVTPDWFEVARSIAAFDSWLRLNPDPALVSQYMDPSNPGYNDAVDGYRRLMSGDWRYSPPPGPITVESARLMSADTLWARVFVRLGPTARYHVVDRDGRSLYDEPAGPAHAVAWVLHFGDGLWRLVRTEAV